jgi:hypothetical protein
VLLPISDEPFNLIPIKNNAFFDEYWEDVERKKVSKSLNFSIFLREKNVFVNTLY